MSTYGALKDDVARFIERDDQGDRIPLWINMAIDEINRVLRVQEMHTFTTLSTVDGQGSLDPQVLEVLNIEIMGSDSRLEYVQPNHFDGRVNSDRSGSFTDGTFYTIQGDQVLTHPSIGNNTLSMRVLQRIPSLSADADTNFLLQRHRDLLLYGAAVHAHRHLGEPEKLAVAQAQFVAIVDQLNSAAIRYGIGPRPRMQPSSAPV